MHKKIDYKSTIYKSDVTNNNTLNILYPISPKVGVFSGQ